MNEFNPRRASISWNACLHFGPTMPACGRWSSVILRRGNRSSRACENWKTGLLES